MNKTNHLSRYFLCYCIPAMIIILLSSCAKKDTLCQDEKGIELLKERIKKSVSDQSDYILQYRKVTDLPQKIDNLFADRIDISGYTYLNGEEKTQCVCSAVLRFNDGDEFKAFVSEEVKSIKEKHHHLDKEYLRNEEKIDYHDKGRFPFNYLVLIDEGEMVANTMDSDVSSLLIDYLEFMEANP